MGQRNGKYITGTPEQECKLLFDSFDTEKIGKLDAKRSQKFLTKMYKANLFRAQELSLKHYLVQMMENCDVGKDGSLSWDDLQAFHGQGTFSDDDKSPKMGGVEEGSEFLWLWHHFGCPMPPVVPTSVPPSSFASSFFRTSSSCFRYGPSLLPSDSSLPRSSSTTVLKTRSSSAPLPFNPSPLPSTPDSICNLLQYLLHQEPRYGFIPEDARSMISAFEQANVPLTLSTFLGKDPSAVDVLTTWKAEDGLRQRMLKMQDSELLKLIKLTAGACERPLLYALNEDIRPALDPFFPYVLQTEIMQYLLEKDSARLTLKQEIAQLLYLIVWRTEEPGLTQAQYGRLISFLETFVEAARQIKPDSYSRRPAETDAFTGLQVFTPPSAADELEMEKLQTQLLVLFCNIQCSLMLELGLGSMAEVRTQLPSPTPTDLCAHCGYSKPASRDCRFRKKRRAAPPSSCKFDPTLTCLGLSIFGVATKTLLFGTHPRSNSTEKPPLKD